MNSNPAWRHGWAGAGAGQNSSEQLRTAPLHCTKHPTVAASCSGTQGQPAPPATGLAARPGSPTPPGKQDKIPSCSRWVLCPDFLRHLPNNHSAHASSGTGLGLLSISAQPSFLSEQFCQLKPLPQVSKGRFLGLKQRKVKVITTVSKSLDHSGIRVFLPTRHSGPGEHSDTKLCHSTQDCTARVCRKQTTSNSLSWDKQFTFLLSSPLCTSFTSFKHH